MPLFLGEALAFSAHRALSPVLKGPVQFRRLGGKLLERVF